MMTRLLPFVFVVAACAAPQRPLHGSLLVMPAELASRLDDPDLIVLHVGERDSYDRRHIPGARHVTQRDLSVPEGELVLQMPPIADLRARLEALGISDSSQVVVYFDNDWVSPSTRVLFTLHHAGLNRVAWLDGGLDAWVRDGHPTTDVAPAIARGTLSAAPARADVADASFVQSRIGTPGFVLIDARDPQFYSGRMAGGPNGLRTSGHITGAVSLPFNAITTEDLRLKPRAELEALFARAGVKRGDTIVTYCHIGQQATAVLFAAQTLGHTVLLYDGSFEDWVRRGLPVTNPASR